MISLTLGWGGAGGGGGFVAMMVEIGVDGLELDVEVGAVVSW